MRAANTGLTAQIMDFFRENPDEWLTIDDAVLKWGATRKQIRDAASGLKQRGEIVRSEDGIIKTVWSQPYAGKP